jgi:hypothetical protein
MDNYTIRIKTISEMIIEDLTHALFDAQEHFNIDIEAEIKSIAKKVEEAQDE